ncbi:unnamed protein product [Aphanomyces euteiches]
MDESLSYLHGNINLVAAEQLFSLVLHAHPDRCLFLPSFFNSCSYITMVTLETLSNLHVPHLTSMAFAVQKRSEVQTKPAYSPRAQRIQVVMQQPQPGAPVKAKTAMRMAYVSGANGRVHRVLPRDIR